MNKSENSLVNALQIIFGYHNRTLRLCGASNHLQENQKTSMKVDRNLIILTFCSL